MYMQLFSSCADATATSVLSSRVHTASADSNEMWHSIFICSIEQMMIANRELKYDRMIKSWLIHYHKNYNSSGDYVNLINITYVHTVLYTSLLYCGTRKTNSLGLPPTYN